jgi:septal ring factor EnvC (AmiA/AmiB activator)
MTTFEALTFALQFLAVLIIPASVWVFIAIQNLKLKQVEIDGELKNNRDRIEHTNANFKQSIKYLDEKIERLEEDMKELKADIKQILKFINGCPRCKDDGK